MLSNREGGNLENKPGVNLCKIGVAAEGQFHVFRIYFYSVIFVEGRLQGCLIIARGKESGNLFEQIFVH